MNYILRANTQPHPLEAVPFSSCSKQLKDAAGQTQTDVKHKVTPRLA